MRILKLTNLFLNLPGQSISKKANVLLATCNYFEKISSSDTMEELPLNQEAIINEGVQSEDVISQETGEPKEQRKAYPYCSIILDTNSRQALENLRDNSILKELKEKKGLMCHHATINMGTSLKGGNYQHGQKIVIPVTDVVAHMIENGQDSTTGEPLYKGIAAAMLSKELIVDSRNPHITLCLNGFAPKDAGKLGAEKGLVITHTFPTSVNQLVGYVNVPSAII